MLAIVLVAGVAVCFCVGLTGWHVWQAGGRAGGAGGGGGAGGLAHGPEQGYSSSSSQC